MASLFDHILFHSSTHRIKMNWLLTTLTGLLTGVVGLFSVGFLGSLCVDWYRVSPREGGAGYFVIALALLGAVVGFILGLVTTYFVAPDHTGLGFLKTLGSSAGVVVTLTGTAMLLCWMLADIPPTVDGRELRLEVELRLPPGEALPVITEQAKNNFEMARVSNHRRASSWCGEYDFAKARETSGRWIIPASVFFFTRRGMRVIEIQMEGRPMEGFGLSLPANPGTRFTEWSDWLPRMIAKDQPWPDTKLSYRFRVRPIVPPPPAPTQEELDAKKFAGLTSDAPLAQWLDFVDDQTVPERAKAAMAVVSTRQIELAGLISNQDARLREKALSAVPSLRKPTTEITEATLAEGREIAAGLRRFNEMKKEDPEFYNVQVELRTRFNYWKQAWWTVHQIQNLDGRPPVQEIFDLANVRATGTSMDEIVLNARVILDALNKADPVAAAATR